MAEYKVIWVRTQLSTDYPKVADVLDVPEANKFMNEHARNGWEVHSVVPGTNAQTYSGLFITFKR